MQQYFEGHLEDTTHKQDVYAFYLTVNATKEGCCVEFSGGYNKETVSTCWRLPAFVRLNSIWLEDFSPVNLSSNYSENRKLNN